MGCGIEPRKIRHRHRGLRVFLARRQYVRHPDRVLSPCLGQRPHHVQRDRIVILGGLGIWPPSSRAVCVRRSALGRRGAEANDARTREVGPRHSSNEAGEQSEGKLPAEASAGAVAAVSVRGAKGGGQGEYAPAKHVLDTEPRLACHRRWSVYGNLCRHTPEAGAICGKAATYEFYAPWGEPSNLSSLVRCGLLSK